MVPRVVIVDDDPDVREMFTIMFKSAGFETNVYSSGEKLLDSPVRPPDIFILDQQLPGIRGTEICRILKHNSLTEKIPVIMVSASPDLEHLSREAGADDCVEKPFSVRGLMEKVEKLVGH